MDSQYILLIYIWFLEAYYLQVLQFLDATASLSGASHPCLCVGGECGIHFSSVYLVYDINIQFKVVFVLYIFKFCKASTGSTLICENPSEDALRGATYLHLNSSPTPTRSHSKQCGIVCSLDSMACHYSLWLKWWLLFLRHCCGSSKPG